MAHIVGIALPQGEMAPRPLLLHPVVSFRPSSCSEDCTWGSSGRSKSEEDHREKKEERDETWDLGDGCEAIVVRAGQGSS